MAVTVQGAGRQRFRPRRIGTRPLETRDAVPGREPRRHRFGRAGPCRLPSPRPANAAAASPASWGRRRVSVFEAAGLGGGPAPSADDSPNEHPSALVARRLKRSMLYYGRLAVVLRRHGVPRLDARPSHVVLLRPAADAGRYDTRRLNRASSSTPRPAHGPSFAESSCSSCGTTVGLLGYRQPPPGPLREALRNWAAAGTRAPLYFVGPFSRRRPGPGAVRYARRRRPRSSRTSTHPRPRSRQAAARRPRPRALRVYPARGGARPARDELARGLDRAPAGAFHLHLGSFSSGRG